MASPYFDFGEDLESNRFLDLYSRFAGGNNLDFGQYLDPKDPDVLKYQQLSASPTGSEELISEYVGRRPTYEDYSPGLGRKMAAFLLGTFSGSPGNAYNLAQKHLYAPYERAYTDWKGEGTGISSRARLMDAERQRELTAAKFGLQQKASTLKAKSSDEARRLAESRRLANEVQQEEQWKENQRRMEENEIYRRNMAEEVFGLRKQIFDEGKRRDAERNTQRETDRKEKDREQAEKTWSLDAINKRLSAFASQHGIDSSDYTAQEIANLLAQKKASEHPLFKEFMTKQGDEYIFSSPNPYRQQDYEKFMKQLVAMYLRGEF